MPRTNANRDQNDVPTLLAVSSVDGTTIVPLVADPITGRLLVDATGSFVNPMTATGDMIYSSDNLGTATRLGIGTTGQVLTVSAGGIPAWAAAPTSLTFSDSLVNAAGTVTLVNDSATPGDSMLYGTNASGVLGWYAIPAISGFVPYTGATTDLNLGTYSLYTTNIYGNSTTSLQIFPLTAAVLNAVGSQTIIKGGMGNGTGTGGQTTIYGGQGGASGAGGTLELVGGFGGATTGDGGSLLLKGGVANNNNSNGGAVYIQEGIPNGTGAVGPIYLEQGVTGTKYTAQLILSSLTANKSFTFPNNSGTLALTSNLTGFEVTSNKATDFSTINNTLYPSVQAVNTAINTAITGLLDYRGSYDASTNLFPATGGSGIAGAIQKGDFWICSVGGTLGGTAVAPSDLIIALTNTPGQTAANWDLVGYALGYTPLSVTGSVTGATSQAQAFTNGITASALSTLTLTTEQLRLAYDGTHYASFTVGSAGNLTLGGTTGKLSVTAFQLGTSTTSGYVLTADSSGNGTWQAAAGAGANTALSNLSAVAINTSLLPGSAAGASLGSAGYPFQYLYLAGASGTPGSNNFLLTGTATAARTITFPDTTDTVAVLGTAQTYTATQTEKSVIWSNNAITCSSNAATVPITYRLNTITNNSAGNMTITMTTAGATDGQLTLIRIYDFSGVSETITWVNTENSNYASAPLTSNGSTTLPLTVGLQYNGATSLWRVIANT